MGKLEQRLYDREIGISESIQENIDDVFDVLDRDQPVPVNEGKGGIRFDPLADDVLPEAESVSKGSAGFRELQAELEDIQQQRALLSKKMKESAGFDKDERDDLKFWSSVLDSRERSAREQLKLFHQNELQSAGQLRKIRIQIEDYFGPEVSVV